ncbi:hypothetical protein GCM10018793_17830 [Streptomyces sulfonofaciens]|uniref:N-formylglutamate amidohydrolase n=1 Tax=Streptomyces sulfonofaciens TaxID=68272 RepID=A0A919KWP8_9ACTN|nr:N-formylglutamate amidohydrolase [Streptomyces sulfonofaciens]GHH75163.1 hypothetical protein GCM10018793_17830 [Streptomyces sulfonofaciens]
MTSEPPFFHVLPGAPGSPVILHVPHSSRVLPGPVRAAIVLDDAALERELDHITDAHTAELAAEATAAAGARRPWRFVNGLSRLVVDPERFPDEREEMRAVGMGAVYTHTTHRAPLRPVETDPAPLLDRYFHPYTEAMTATVDERLAATGRAVIIDVHSYPTHALPYELHGHGPRPPICLGADDHHTPPALLDLAHEVFADFGGVDVNTPFAGAYVPLKHHRTTTEVSSLMIEIRRDLYMSEPGGPAGLGLAALGTALAELVERAS